MGKLILKFKWIFKGTQITQTIFKKNKLVELICLDFKFYYKATNLRLCGTGLRTDL